MLSNRFAILFVSNVPTHRAHASVGKAAADAKSVDVGIVQLGPGIGFSNILGALPAFAVSGFSRHPGAHPDVAGSNTPSGRGPIEMRYMRRIGQSTAST